MSSPPKFNYRDPLLAKSTEYVYIQGKLTEGVSSTKPSKAGTYLTIGTLGLGGVLIKILGLNRKDKPRSFTDFLGKEVEVGKCIATGEMKNGALIFKGDVSSCYIKELKTQKVPEYQVGCMSIIGSMYACIIGEAVARNDSLYKDLTVGEIAALINTYSMEIGERIKQSDNSGVVELVTKAAKERQEELDNKMKENKLV